MTITTNSTSITDTAAAFFEACESGQGCTSAWRCRNSAGRDPGRRVVAPSDSAPSGSAAGRRRVPPRR